MSELVLGGASLNKLSLVETTKFLEESQRLKIIEIDSAPLYGVEEKLGEILDRSKEFVFNSKVGRPLEISFTPSEIEMQVQKTLHDLRIEQLNVLFVHSLPVKMLSDKVLAKLEELKSQKIVKFIGYSGDAADLKKAHELNYFDKFMGTLNYLDLGNYETLRDIPADKIYLKRILANGVFSRESWISRLRGLVHQHEGINQNSYSFRHKILSVQDKVNLEQAISFVNTKFSETQKVVGMGSILHLRQISTISSRNETWSEEQFTSWLEYWRKKQRCFEWSVIT